MEAFIKFGVGTVAVVALILSLVGITHQQSPTVVNNNPTPSYGAVSGPDLNSGGAGFTFDGVAIRYARLGLNTASTTSCIFKTPSATSSLLAASVNIKVNQAAETVNFTTGTAPQASTTALSSNYPIAAGAQGLFVASTTNPDTTRILNPNTYVQVNIFGGSGVASSSGICQASFEIL